MLYPAIAFHKVCIRIFGPDDRYGSINSDNCFIVKDYPLTTPSGFIRATFLAIPALATISTTRLTSL